MCVAAAEIRIPPPSTPPPPPTHPCCITAEGPIGSHYKIDASYLSPAVNVTARLESATRLYGVDIILSQAFAECLSEPAQNLLRLVDKVVLKGVAQPIALYTMDWHPDTALKLLRGELSRRAAVAASTMLAASSPQTHQPGRESPSPLVPSLSPAQSPSDIISAGSIGADARPAATCDSFHELMHGPGGDSAMESSHDGTVAVEVASPSSLRSASGRYAPAPPPDTSVLSEASPSPTAMPAHRTKHSAKYGILRYEKLGSGAGVPGTGQAGRSSPPLMEGDDRAARSSHAPAEAHADGGLVMRMGSVSNGVTALPAAHDLCMLQPATMFPPAFLEHAENAVGVSARRVPWGMQHPHAYPSTLTPTPQPRSFTSAQ